MNPIEPSDEVLAALSAGRKIEAIKLLREEHGLSLAEAKEAVESYPMPHRGNGSFTSRHAAGQEDRGNFRLIAVMVVLGGLLAWLLLT